MIGFIFALVLVYGFSVFTEFSIDKRWGFDSGWRHYLSAPFMYLWLDVKAIRDAWF